MLMPASQSFDNKSKLGYLLMLAGGPVSVVSTTAKTVDTSSSEAELHAAYFAAKECVFISQLMFDLKMTSKRSC